MTKILSTSHYPFSCYQKPRFRHFIMLGLGSNQGQSEQILNMLFKSFQKHSKVQILATSPLWLNPPFGFQAQNDFYNAIMLCSCKLCFTQMRALIFYLERRFGRARKRAFANAPRTLDIDMIIFDNLHIKWRDFTLPHTAYKSRASVILPLSFIV